MKRALITLSISLCILLPALYLFSREEELYSFAIGYISSSLVLLASFRNYAKAVQARLEAGVVDISDDRDTIDRLEDPYGLYEEENGNDDEEKDIREIIKKEKALMKRKRRSLIRVLADASPALSILRLGAYLLLIGGFFYLNKTGRLDILHYLISLFIPVLLTVWSLMAEAKE